MIHTTWQRAKHKHWLTLDASSRKKSSSDAGAVRGTAVRSNTLPTRVRGDTSHSMMGRVSTSTCERVKQMLLWHYGIHWDWVGVKILRPLAEFSWTVNTDRTSRWQHDNTYQEESKRGHEAFLGEFPRATVVFLIDLLEAAEVHVQHAGVDDAESAVGKRRKGYFCSD